MDLSQAPHAKAVASSTSYFSAPETSLDPKLFLGDRMRPEVSQALSQLLLDHLTANYTSPLEWVKLWLAGSGASYQWSAAREPGDLDMLIGIDYPLFRERNPQYVRLSNAEISQYVTDKMRTDLTPKTSFWSPPGFPDDHYEVTWYSNAESTDIRDINPYAAYEVLTGTWDVRPDPQPFKPTYDTQSEGDKIKALALLDRYTRAQAVMESNPTNPVIREQAETVVRTCLQQATAMFDSIHEGRHAAFGWGGKGYADPANYRWQAGKANGVIQALGELRGFYTSSASEEEIRRYGVSLPSVDTLLLRALTVQQGDTR